MAISQEYKEFSAEAPWGRGATVVTEDNVIHSRVRHAAIMAMRQGRATPEQAALVYDADAAIQMALKTETNSPTYVHAPIPPPPPALTQVSGGPTAPRRITL